MSKGVIYYTDNRIAGPIIDNARKTILASGLPIVSCSLRPIDFGDNIVLKNRNRSYPTMVDQIILCLENIKTDYVFFCEHDVLYHKTHFDYTPPTDTIYYYNVNNWRWQYPTDRIISYERLTSLSMLVCNRELVLDHFKRRREFVGKLEWDINRAREPRWARLYGYEPGTKKKKRGGFSDDDFIQWRSEYPDIDIRHAKTFTKHKTHLEDFKHPPKHWKERTIDQITGWNLRSMFNL